MGFTAGYGRSSRDYYEEHGVPKQLYVRELRRRAIGILRQGRLPADLAAQEEKIIGPCPLRATHLGSLLEVFEEFRDKRRGHGLRHRQPFVMACAALAMLLGAGGYEAFEEECGKLTQRQLRALGCRKDPKSDLYRGPSDTTFFRVLSAVSHRLRLTVAQQPVEEKSNEIPALEPLLRKLPQGALEGSLITADAMQCQQESSRLVTQDLGGDYLWGLKGNQSGILEQAQKRLPKDFFSL